MLIGKVTNLLSGAIRSPIFRQIGIRLMSSQLADGYNYETLKVMSPREYVLQVELDRPDKRNALSTTMWKEFVTCFQQISEDKDCRAVVISGSGKVFTAGIDLQCLAEIAMQTAELDAGRKAMTIRKVILAFQDSFTVFEKCPKPVIAAVHGGCIGAGIDLITACDMRFCSKDAWFQIKEVDIGIAADVGTLQRLPKIIGNDSLARELAYTARPFYADEAKEMGLVSRVFPDKETMINGTLDIASLIASKSPIAVQGTKVNLIYSRDHSVPESLQYIANWNQVMLQSEDIVKAMTEKPPVFSKL